MSQSISPFTEVYLKLRLHGLVNPGRMAPSLEQLTQVLDFLGNPQDAVAVIHIAGTSGKTPVAGKVAALLHQQGRRVGSGVSPGQPLRRLRIGMIPVRDRHYNLAMDDFLKRVHSAGVPLTHAELAAAFQYWYFARQPVDVVVMQAGIGGLVDPTNVVSSRDKVCVLAGVGLEHGVFLGPTLRDAAEHTAGIIQPGNAVFCFQQKPEVMDVIRSHSRQKQADLNIVAQDELCGAVAKWALGQEC